jgi:4-amino-4-deoxy-L-arabinose transferase-like glycosyltransferase
MEQKLSSEKALTLLVLSVYFLLLGYKLMRLGIHADGMEYANVARNMADGLGTFWKPYHDDIIHPVFHEHPPLVFWIQSLFFKLFGDGPYIENFYGLIVGLVIFSCTAMFWQQVRHDFQHSSLGNWWPILLLLSLPIYSYILQINRLVNTFTIFAILAAYFAYLSAIKKKFTIVFSLLSGVFIYLGFIAKGPVALFSIILPILAWMVFKAKLSKVVISTLVSVATFIAALLATFYFSPDSVDFWRGFWRNQVVLSLMSQRSAGDSHWYLVERWAAQMVVPAIIAVVFMALTRTPYRHIRFNRPALFFIFVGLASSLPFLISTRQHNRYIFQSYPFYVLGLAFLTESIGIKIQTILKERQKIRKVTVMLTVVFFLSAISIMVYRKDHIRKDRYEFYHDIYLNNIQLPERITISACPGAMIREDWIFVDMQRFYKISLTPKMGNAYLIVDKNSECIVDPGYQKVHNRPIIKYMLYKKSDR